MTEGSSTPRWAEAPPPGWQPPVESTPRWTSPGSTAAAGSPSSPGYGQEYGQYRARSYQPVHQSRPVYKPGTVPLRPLGLGDVFSGSVETIRRNPRATIGLAAVVLTAFMLVPIAGALLWGAFQGFGSRLTSSGGTQGISAEDLGLILTFSGGLLLNLLATVVMTGMTAHVVEHAARGRKLAPGAAWQLTRPRVWRLLGLSALTFGAPLVVVWAPIGVLVVLAALASPAAGWTVGVLGTLGGLALTFYGFTRLFALAPATLVLEGRNVFASLRRSWALTRGEFWRIFGISALTTLVVVVAGYFLLIPFNLLSTVGLAIWPDTLLGVLVGLLIQNVAVVVGGSLITPFWAGVTALQYLDQRIRKEGYDIELIGQVSAAASGVPGWTA